MLSDVVRCDESSRGLLGPAADDSRCIKDDRSGWTSRAALMQAVNEVGLRISQVNGGLVFLFASNDVSTVVGFLAAWSKRMPVALLDPHLPTDSVERLIGTYQPEVVFGRELANENSRYRSHCIQHVLGTSVINFDRTPCRNTIDPDLALLLSTSGSTGSPKFVRLARSAVVANARQIVRALSIDATDVGIGHLPLHYSYGLSVVTSHLFAGASISLTNAQVTEAAFWGRISEDFGTHFPGVPFHYSVLDRLGVKRMVPSSVRTFTQAGGHLDHGTRLRCHQAISERGGRFYVMYGQTEAGPRMTTLQSDDFPKHSTTVGVALEGGTLSIVDDSGLLQPANVEGNVVYHGPNVMMGYATDRDHLALSDMQGGRLETGDRGVLSEDGFLTLTGRTQRFAKIAGLRIALDEIEASLGCSGSVAALAPKDKIVLYVQKSVAPEVKTMVAQLAQRMRLPSTVFVTRAVDSIPFKSSGKIDYKALELLE
jgi:acyl-coenzyme A synthetase/AMP-(fatty) acid ligase